MPNVSWEDIGGLENVKRELQEVIDFTNSFIQCSFSDHAKFLYGNSCFLFAPVDCSISSGAS